MTSSASATSSRSSTSRGISRTKSSSIRAPSIHSTRSSSSRKCRMERTDADGIIWVKTVEDYQRFGVVVTDADGNMTRIVEKPSTPISKRANIGLYYIRNWKLLYEGIDWVLKQPKNKGAYYLT